MRPFGSPRRSNVIPSTPSRKASSRAQKNRALSVPKADSSKRFPVMAFAPSSKGRSFTWAARRCCGAWTSTPATPIRDAADRAASRGQASVYLLTSTRAIAAFAVADAMRAESREAIQRLHDNSIEVVMLTGDAKAVANAVAADLGIDTVFAEVLPDDKVDKIKELKAAGKRVAMVGDGVNDAPALVTADVGDRDWRGHRCRREAGDVVLVRSDPTRCAADHRPQPRQLSEDAPEPLVGRGLQRLRDPARGWRSGGEGILLPPAFAAVLMSASTVIVAINAQLLRRAKL